MMHADEKLAVWVEKIPTVWRLGLLAVMLALATVLATKMNIAAILGSQSGATSMVARVYGSYAPLVWTMLGTTLSLLAIGFFAWPAALFFPAHKRRAKVTSYEFWLDVIYAFQGLWLGPTLLFVAVGWLVEVIYGGLTPWFPILGQLPFWIQVLAGVWAFDFVVYWRHRLEHRLALLWSFHAVHHTTEKVDFLTTLRVHPFELALGMFLNVFVMKLGLSAAATGLAFAIYLKWNYFIHSNVRIRFPGALKYILVSPFMHHWHHAKDIAAAGKNVGVVFAWNDFLFRTAHHPQHWPAEYGFTAPKMEQVGQSYVRQMLYPLQFLFSRVWNRYKEKSQPFPEVGARIPSYYPELNPEERLNGDLKQGMGS